jgi:serine/threonine-protein kinase SRPK3
LDENILLVDMGQSFSFSCPPQAEDVGIPFSYCAPEVIFDSKVSKYSEIWALGCVIFELRAGSQLFSSWFGDKDEILRQMVQIFGRLPDPWWTAWDKRADFFDDGGKPKKEWSDGIPKAVEYSIEKLIADIGFEDQEDEEPRKAEELLDSCGKRVEEEEAVLLTDLLKSIFKLVPEERAGLEEILKHAWFDLET